MTSPNTQHVARETWLLAALPFFDDLLEAAGREVPPVRVSIEPPRVKRGGVCHARSWDKREGRNHIFISARLEDPSSVLEMLAHEYAHATDDCAHHHSKPFQNICQDLLLEGGGPHGKSFKKSRWSPEGRNIAKRIIDANGGYPHSAMHSHELKGPSRRIKVTCRTENAHGKHFCGYSVETTATALANVGAPICPNCMRSMSPIREVEIKPPLDVGIRICLLATEVPKDDRETLIAKIELQGFLEALPAA